MSPERWQQIKEVLDQALEHSPPSRGKFLEVVCSSDEDLRREVESFLEFEELEADFIEESAFDLVKNSLESKTEKEFIGKSFGRYRVVRELGTGGMGAVYLAVRDDGEFEQKVAVKLIKSGVNSDAVRRRFNFERRILASLEHANIARLIDGGTTEEDLPFFILEYVEGTPITEYARTKNLNLTERLDLFRKVCAAVSFAHAHLVVHRDLKPSNILVTEDGTPKLLDFGIAKLLKSETTKETQTHTIAFTPEYASPEQLRGEQLTTATDVYSLGVILYELLTETRPFSYENKNFGEIIESSSRIQPVRPSRIAESKSRGLASKSKSGELNQKSKIKNLKSLRGDLDNIVLKALNKEPARRYASIEQFSEDVHRFLRGLTVKARPDTLLYRTEKFIRRNPLVFAAALVAVLSLIGGIIAAGYQAQQANKEREIAQKRFNDVRQLANSFVFEINDEIDKSPIKARELLVKRAIEYLDKLSHEAGDDVSLQIELASAYEKIGDVQAELNRPNLGDTHDAIESYQKALKIRQELFNKEPQNAQVWLSLSSSYIKTGDVSSKTGNITAALENYRQAVNLNEKFTQLEPMNIRARQQLSQSLLKLGQALFRTGNLSEVLANYRRSLAIQEQIAQEYPQDSKLQRPPAVVLNYIGYVLMEMGNLSQSLESYHKSLTITEKIYGSDDVSLQAQRDIRVFNHWLGVIYSVIGDNQTSLRHHQKSQAITRNLLTKDPTDIQERNTLADSQLETAKTLTQMKRIDDALKSFADAVENYEKVQETDTDNKHVRRQIFYTKLFMAGALDKNGKPDKALEMYQQTLEAFRKLTAADPHNREWQHDLATSNLKIGEILLKRGEKKQASERFHEARQILEPLNAESPEHLRRQQDLETVQNYLAKINN